MKLAAARRMAGTDVETEFLRAHVGNRTAHAVFADAIRYGLRHGPAATPELYSVVQSLLPDLCEDSVELVINGQHFGKKWKHGVRTAQMFLRRRREIELIGNKWRLCK